MGVVTVVFDKKLSVLEDDHSVQLQICQGRIKELLGSLVAMNF